VVNGGDVLSTIGQRNVTATRNFSRLAHMHLSRVLDNISEARFPRSPAPGLPPTRHATMNAFQLDLPSKVDP
jgi:hypothetical protein